MKVNFYFQAIVTMLSLISMLGNIWVTYVYFTFKELQQHPSTILSWISLFEISMSHHSIALVMSSNLSIHGHGPHHIFQLLTFFQLSESSAKIISCCINRMLFSGAVSGLLCYNIFLSIDLIITLRNPLISGKTRMKYYHIVTWVIIFVNMTYNLFENLQDADCSINYLKYLDQVWNYGLITLVCILLLGSACLSVVIILLKKKEQINEHTKRYLKRHIKYLFVVSLIWTICTLYYWRQSKDRNLVNEEPEKDYVIITILVLISSSGAIQALLRNWEPAFWKCSKSIFRKKSKVQSTSVISNSSSFLIRDYRENEDMWNMPMSFLVQENMKSNTTLCILSGIFETIKNADFVYKTDFNVSSEVRVVKKRKIWFSEVRYKIPGLNFGIHPFFIVEEYCPVIFNRLRLLEGITKEGFLQSLDPENNQKTLFSLNIEQGGSGSMFIFTEDNLFVIKTLQKSERNFLIKELLPEYLEHIEKNCHSLLNRIFGVFTIKIPGLAPLDLILTQSLLKGDLIKYYDIKGSSYNRLTESMGVENFKGPFKDIDFISHGEKIDLNRCDKEEIKENMVKDLSMLLSHGIMDYSLIIVALKRESEKSFYNGFDHRWYRFGVIDFLGQYTLKRKAEYYIKKLRFGKNIRMCSVMKPKSYYVRLIEFVFEKVF